MSELIHPASANAAPRSPISPSRRSRNSTAASSSLSITTANGEIATKGSFDSSQAAWAKALLRETDISALTPGTTYLFEAIYPENRIVVRYAGPALVMLAAYDKDGRELAYAGLLDICTRAGWRPARRDAFPSIAEMIDHAAGLPKDEEGFVVRFANGLRLKLKGAAYRRIHALISRCTPLAMWEAMNAGDDLDAIRRDLPEEFWQDFDDITRFLKERVTALESAIISDAASVSHLSDKELGLSPGAVPEDVRPYVFAYRKHGEIARRARDGLMRSIRPTGNELPGYVPSYAMGRMMEEAG